jgi:hypothetical protein
MGILPPTSISEDMEQETAQLLQEHREAVADVVRATEANRKANNIRLHQSIENARERTKAFVDFETLLRRDEQRRLNNGHHR